MQESGNYTIANMISYYLPTSCVIDTSNAGARVTYIHACANIDERRPKNNFAPGIYHFLRGRKKGPGIICSRMREIPRKVYAWIFSVYLLVVFRYIPAYVQRMMAESDVCGCCCLVSEQTLYKTLVDALCTCTYVAMLHVHIVGD